MAGSQVVQVFGGMGFVEENRCCTDYAENAANYGRFTKAQRVFKRGNYSCVKSEVIKGWARGLAL